MGAVFLGSLILGVLDTIARERDLSRLAMTDPLTGLLNRRGLGSAYEAWQRQAGERGGALIATIDIDPVKQFDDEHGHPAGDLAPTAVARAIRDHRRDGDLGACIGGDEFLMGIRDAAPHDSRLIRRRIHRGLAELHVSNDTGDRRPIGLSIGSDYVPASAPLLGGPRLPDEQMDREKAPLSGRAVARRAGDALGARRRPRPYGDRPASPPPTRA